ncbi:MAG TPA: hypothetical protein VFI45_19020 [Candidatus Acidoferrum sp.]|nr:hypothetical protein [Candidatus Acidoferrum sp.]
MIRSKMRMGILWAIVAMALHLWPGVVKPAHGQGSRKDDIVFNTRGVPLAGATVRVCAMPASGQPCTPLALIYSDAALTQALANPTATDGLGNYSFYAAPGKYEIEISGPGITTKQLPNVILPSDPSSPTFNSLSSTGGISAFSLSLTGNLTVNGSTSVVGNLASGTLTLSNQGTAPGAASSGTVNLYTKSADKRLYYKDETGTEVGPISTASGAQTNQTNTFTAPQNFDADVHPKGPNPWLDITRFGGYVGPNYNVAATTCSINSGSASASCAAASDFQNGHGVLILGAGPAPGIATPQAPTATPIFQVGTTQRNYCVADRDWAGGITPCGAVGITTTAPASMAVQSYGITGTWTFSNGVYTVTTSSAHNMPTTSSGIQSEPYAQIEIQRGTTNNIQCEGAFSLSAVPSTTTFQFTRNDLTAAGGANPACTGGTLRVAPKIILKWDSHYTYSVQSATCSGGTATVTISPGVFGPTNTAAPTWVVPWFVNAIFSGVTDSHYNGTFVISNFTPAGTAPNAVQYSIGSCTGVSNVGAGGTMTMVPGKAVKNHLIYECTGTSCALPANAANYSLVGVATGNDGYFVDRGWATAAASVDTGDVPATAPTTATNEYLDTTIAAGGGTTSLTLAATASNTVSGAKAFHDNTPNLLLACAALAANSTGANGGRIVIPAATSIYQFFPLIGNFDMMGNFNQNPRNCPGNTTIQFHPTVYLMGTILMGGGDNLLGGLGSTNCVASFYKVSSSQTCLQGTAYPLVYFEPETTLGNYLENLVLSPLQAYQSGIYLDEQLNRDGVVALRFEHVHVNGGAHSYSVINKTGFGFFWNYGGWSASGGNFSEGFDYTITHNCGMPAYLPTPPAQPYIFTTNQTYSFGTFEVDSCGQANGTFGSNVTFNQVLTENGAGPAFKFNTFPYGPSGITFSQGSYADFTGGFATPYFDLTNATASGMELNYLECGNSTQPLLQTGTTASFYAGITVRANQNSCGGNIGAVNYRYDNLSSNLGVVSGYNTQLNAGAQVFSPMTAPANFQSVTAVSGTGLAPGTYNYCAIAVDPFGGVTATNPLACTQVTTTTGTQSVQLVMPASFPAGAAGLLIYDQTTGHYVIFNSCALPQVSVPGSTVTLTTTFEGCVYTNPFVTTAVANFVSTSNGIGGSKLLLNGEFLNAAPRSEQNIFLPGGLSTAWTGSTWTLDRGVTVTRVQVQAKTAPAGCTTNAVVRLTDGTTPVNVTIAAAANDSGAIAQNYASGAALTLSVQTAAAGCTTTPADANVTIQYRMQ